MRLNNYFFLPGSFLHYSSPSHIRAMRKNDRKTADVICGPQLKLLLVLGLE
jgi:hypothetical protein